MPVTQQAFWQHVQTRQKHPPIAAPHTEPSEGFVMSGGPASSDRSYGYDSDGSLGLGVRGVIAQAPEARWNLRVV